MTHSPAPAPAPAPGPGHHLPAGLTLSARRLCREVQRLRIEAGLSQRDVAHALEWSASKQEKTENGAITMKVVDVRAQLDLFGTPEPEREMVLELCRDARRRRWWHAYADVISRPLALRISGEDDAATLATFQVGIIPSLLQTPAYARTVYRALRLGLPEEDVDRLVEVLAERQKVLTKPSPLRVHAVVDEAALYRCVGGTAVMADQLAHLGRAGQLPQVSVQVLPYLAGAQPSMTSGMSVLDFSDPRDAAVAFRDEYTPGEPVVVPDTVEVFRTAFDALTRSALPEADSVTLIKELIR
jgi:transcriptional regulator with XRE-family HTH domain